MYCRYCGSLISDDSKFCENCGNRIAAERVEVPKDTALEVIPTAENILEEDPYIPFGNMKTYKEISDRALLVGVLIIFAGFIIAVIGAVIASDTAMGLGCVSILVGVIATAIVMLYYYSKLTEVEKEVFKKDYANAYKIGKKKTSKISKQYTNQNNVPVSKRICSKCHSDNIQYQTLTEKKPMGCGTLLWYFFLFVTLIGWFILIPLFFSNKRQETVTYAVCQNCGHRWKVD